MAFTIVNGTVNRVFETRTGGVGVSVKEPFTKRDGSDSAKYYTAWFESDPGLAEGVSGKFSGLLNVKKSEYEKDGKPQVGIDVSLNNAKFEAVDNDAEEPF